VIEAPSRNDRSWIGDEGGNAAPADIIRELERMAPNIADAAACTGICGIGAPFRLLVAASLDRFGEPALRIFDDDPAYISDVARRNQRPCHAQHRAAGIGVCQGMDLIGGSDRATEPHRFGPCGTDNHDKQHFIAP